MCDWESVARFCQKQIRIADSCCSTGPGVWPRGWNRFISTWKSDRYPLCRPRILVSPKFTRTPAKVSPPSKLFTQRCDCSTATRPACWITTIGANNSSTPIRGCGDPQSFLQDFPSTIILLILLKLLIISTEGVVGELVFHKISFFVTSLSLSIATVVTGALRSGDANR